MRPAARTVADFASHFSAPQAAPLIVRSVAEMHAVRAGMDVAAVRARGAPARVNFVPTMGALHAGHTGLVDAARARADFVVASVFVNPAQFAPHEDLAAYPRTWAADVAALAARRVDVVYAPTAASMYPPGAPFRSWIAPAGVDAATPEGAARPGFFRGVATVVAKLLAAVRPAEAWFGQKDGVQCIVVRALVRDLSLPTRVRIGATARAPDGLALSSRNVYLTRDARAGAGAIFAALTEARDAVAAAPEAAAARARAAAHRAGAAGSEPGAAADADAAAERAAQAAAFGGAAAPPLPPRAPDALLASVEARVRARILASPTFSAVDYAVFSDALSGAPVRALGDSGARRGAVMLSVAARAGATRLLDNIMLVGSHDDLGAAPGDADDAND